MFTMTEELREKIEKAVKEMEMDAYMNPHLTFCLYLDEDGELCEHHEAASSNFRPSCLWDGSGLLVHECCHQYYDPFEDSDDINNDYIVGRMEEYHPELAEDIRAAYEDIKDDCGYWANGDIREELKNRYPEQYDEVKEEYYKWFKRCLLVSVDDDFEVEVEFDN